MAEARPPTRQHGSILIIIMIGLACSAIALTAAVQAWSTTWRRDSEQELIFRGRQYVNALMLYSKEHGGQYPLNLNELMKPGPRRVRYIRKLYKDPVNPGGKWGLLYLMPGGRQIFDPKNPQGGQQVDTSGRRGASSLGFGVTDTGGGDPGAPPAGLPPGVPLPLPPEGSQGDEADEKSVSETPIGWPIGGVVSRARGELDESTFKIYKGHEEVSDWQFHVLELQGEMPQIPGMPGMPVMPGGVGPGIGGHPVFGNPGGRPGMMPGGYRPNQPNKFLPNQNPYGNNPGSQNNPYQNWPYGTGPKNQKGGGQPDQ